jgi:hypothetical protein
LCFYVFFTAPEAAAFERGDADRLLKYLPELEQKLNSDLVGDFNTSDRGRIDPSRRTSLLVDPPDGRLPPVTPEEKARREKASKARKEPPDDPEVLNTSTRCLPDVAGPPLLPTDYNNNVQIVVTPHHVVIATEMVHEARIVPLDGRPHLPARIREWDGDSRGHWDGAAPWSGTYTFHRTTNRIYEFACHEANYSIVNMLKGARLQERQR